MNTRPAPWSDDEDRLIISDYLAMLAAVNRGERINKAATRRALLPQLNNRSEASIEFKRCNISAALESFGFGWLPGYRPAQNYQRKLVELVRAELVRDLAPRLRALDLNGFLTLEDHEANDPTILRDAINWVLQDLKAEGER